MTLYDVTHLGCHSARCTPAPAALPIGLPASVDADYFKHSEADFSGIRPEEPMLIVDGCTKLDYAVLFVTALHTPAATAADTTTAAAATTPAAECDHSLAVYLGNGYFWHTQYDFHTVELDAGGPIQRGLGSVTGRARYTGGRERDGAVGPGVLPRRAGRDRVREHGARRGGAGDADGQKGGGAVRGAGQRLQYC